MKQFIASVTAACVWFSAPVIGEDTGIERPEGVSLVNMQSGPFNRWAFSHIRELLPTVNVEAAHTPSPLAGEPISPSDVTLMFMGQTRNLEDIIKDQMIDGILIMKDGKVLVEGYYGALTPAKQHLMMSMTKSVVATVAGILEAKGVLSYEKTAGEYIPELKGSGYADATLRTLLDMRDDSAYSEDYADPNSSVRIQECAYGWRPASDCPEDSPKNNYEFLPTVGLDPESKGHFHYRSGTTDVVGWILERATGKRLGELITEYIWQPMGAEHDAYITVDTAGSALANGGMNTTLRDMARFGQVMLNGGKGIVPPAFIEDVKNQAGDPHWPYEEVPGWSPYYRSFWWGVGDGDKDFEAVGINGQVLRIAPKDNMVIAVFSSWPSADGGTDTTGWGAIGSLMAAIKHHYRK